jgi:guanylate kinase
MKDNSKTGKLIVLSAPSGAGKTTIARHLLEAGLNLKFSISACSREKREGETDGEDYYFLSESDFKSHIDQGNFLEWEEVYPGHFYGTLKSEVERIIGSGSNVLFDVDVIGGLNIKKYYGDKALAIFIKPPSVSDLENRLRARSTDSEEKIRMRLNKAIHELSFASDFDLVIINDNLGIAKKEAEDSVRIFLEK